MKYLRHVFLLGPSEESYAQWFEANKVAHTRCGNIDNAVNLAHSMAQSQRGLPGGGKIVLFCSMLNYKDIFETAEQSAQAYAEIVIGLSEEGDQ